MDVNEATWMTPILNYFQMGFLSIDPTKAKQLQIRMAHFTIGNGQLYKQGYSLPLLLYITTE